MKLRLPRRPTKEGAKRKIHDVNQFFGQPLVIIAALLLLFIYFAAGNAQFQKDNRTLLERTKTSAENTGLIVDQLKKVLCEQVPAKDCNLSKAVAELKADNDNKTNIIICMLQVPVNQRTTDLEQNCRKEFTASPLTSATPSASPQASPQKSSGTSGNSSSPKTAPDNGNGQGNNPPKGPNCTIDILFLHAGRCQ